MRTLRITSTVAPIAVLAVALLMLTNPAPAFAASGLSFIAHPASRPADQPGYFKMQVAAGGAASGKVQVSNPSSHTIVVHLAAVDSGTAPLGGVTYSAIDEKPTATGTWIRLDRSCVTLSPQETEIVPFAVNVPEGAAEGDHVAGVALWAKDAETKTATTEDGKAGATVSVQRRRIIAAQVVVPGTAQAQLAVGGVSPVARPTGMYLDVRLDNAGTSLTADGAVHLDLPGKDFSYDGALSTSVPGSSFEYPVLWTRQPADGVYPAHVLVRYGTRTAEWTGEFRIGKEQQDQLVDRLVGGTVKSSEDHTWTYLFVGVASVVVVLVVIAVATRRKSQSGPRAS